MEGAILEVLACAAYNANMAYIIGTGGQWQPEWSRAEEWQQASTRAGVKMLLENPDLTPEEIHAAWLEYKKSEGWICGPEKDAAAKTHPCLLPWGELPEVEQKKDYIFASVVRDVFRVFNTENIGGSIPEAKPQLGTAGPMA